MEDVDMSWTMIWWLQFTSREDKEREKWYAGFGSKVVQNELEHAWKQRKKVITYRQTRCRVHDIDLKTRYRSNWLKCCNCNVYSNWCRSSIRSHWMARQWTPYEIYDKSNYGKHWAGLKESNPTISVQISTSCTLTKIEMPRASHVKITPSIAVLFRIDRFE